MTAGAGARVLCLIAAGGFAGCGGSLTEPGVPPTDAAASAGTDASPGIGWPRRQDATVSVPDAGMGMNPCLNKPAQPIDGTTCLYSIPDADVCTGLGIRVHVLIDGTEVPQLADDGWTFIDASETSIELHGPACERALQSPTGPTIHFTFYLP